MEPTMKQIKATMTTIHHQYFTIFKNPCFVRYKQRGKMLLLKQGASNFDFHVKIQDGNRPDSPIKMIGLKYRLSHAQGAINIYMMFKIDQFKVPCRMYRLTSGSSSDKNIVSMKSFGG
jgi:hypothetical protein